MTLLEFWLAYMSFDITRPPLLMSTMVLSPPESSYEPDEPGYVPSWAQKLP
jgi:hypothetical protein